MGGGGKGGGGAPEIPQFVRESQRMGAERAQQLFDIGFPAMQAAAGQIGSLQRTGGPGAGVPVVAKAEQAQRQAADVANRQIEQQLARSGAPGEFGALRERIGQQQQIAARSIAPQFSAPLISALMGTAVGGPGLAQAGFQQAGQALASGIRRPGAGATPNFGEIGGNVYDVLKLTGSTGGGKSGGGGLSSGAQHILM